MEDNGWVGAAFALGVVGWAAIIVAGFAAMAEAWWLVVPAGGAGIAALVGGATIAAINRLAAAVRSQGLAPPDVE